MRDQAVIDFETKPIDQRPRYPPEPVGLAVKLPGEPHTYLSWGHPSENGVFILKGKKLVKRDGDAKKIAKVMLKDAFACDSVLGHNIAKFDLDVAETHMGVKAPPWNRVDDSLFTRFLADPHASTLALKPSAEAVLGEAPEERDQVFDWLAAHGIIQKPRMEHGKAKYQRDAGARIGDAPGALVAPYAIGDLTRSKGLFDKDYAYVKANGMLEAYRREQRVAPILLANEREGMRVDLPRLERDLKIYKQALAKVESWLRKRLNTPPGINWDSDDDVAAVLKRSKVVKDFPKTATGKDSVSKSRLTAEFYSDPNVYRALVYRNTVAYVLSQNIVPWHEKAQECNGRIFTQWQQVRSDREQGGGARSGRITCSKWANIIKDPTGGKNPDYLVKDDEIIRKLIKLPPIPLARIYCLPDEGDLFGHVDWNQQELRLTAHYEDAELSTRYKQDPSADIHQFATDLINAASNHNYVRPVIKHVNLRQFYGGGQEGLVAHPMLRLDKVHGCRMGCQHREERCEAYKATGVIVRDWRAGLPGVVRLTKSLSAMYQRGEPIRTLGGRLYHCKPPAVAKKGPMKGRMVTFEYTGLNYLIQPSGADCLKMALIAYDEHPKRKSRMIGTVYDETNISAPKKIAQQQVRVLQEVMESIKLDVPWKTDGDVRPNWGEKATK